MSKRTPAPKPGATEITDEWGIYDPDKAGMQALFKRLGRPILQASTKKSRNERRRAQRPERTSHGVGLALEEARRRAGLLSKDGFEPIGQSPARAMRAAMRHQHHVPPTHFVPDAEPHAAPASAPHHRGHAPATVMPVTAAAPARRTRATKRATTSAQAEPAATATPAQSTERSRARRAPRARQVVTTPAASAIAAAPEAPKVKAGPPAPSPRRPRGPVPLAAWAHAADSAPPQTPRRVDPLGFWRGWFRMPAEVALVEYARGARIHRLLIESVEDQPVEMF